MNEINDGGPAFPEVPGECNVYQGKPGMKLRDYIAVNAMRVCAPRHVHPDSEVRYVAPISFDDLAKDAYALADAMLRARGVA
ncbi:hypothetical protein KTD31_17145 [Burkholderia multivorans]|uniref:hypothetical protein n=1 Tax=Burkholderia multivorans TaxID=87883 RepID=UPI001C230CD4|nr:hypothetical protein [Burkholderia multivorans]MBU9203084.1 hypothetical protein [Burkholderia multivorans]MCA8385324.1 hypothetical protein [Burkholderia multivorans]